MTIGTSSRQTERLDPGRPGHAEQTAALAVQRAARERLAAFLAERPRGHDAALARSRQRFDAGSEPAEHEDAALAEAARVCARAVERGPHELRPGVRPDRDPRRR